MNNFPNEKESAELILSDGFTNGRVNKYEMILIAKHFKWNLGYGTSKIRSGIIAFCEEREYNFNPVVSRKFLNDVVRISENSMFKEYTRVQVTSVEIEKIRVVKNFDYQKILFVILVFSKMLKFSSSGLSKSSDRKHFGYYISLKMIPKIKKECGIRISNKDILFSFHELYKMGFVEPTYYNSLRILFADEGGVPEIFVNDFENVIDLFIDYVGGEKLYCEKCGIEFDKISRKKKLCEKCYGESRFEKNRGYFAKYSAKNKK